MVKLMNKLRASTHKRIWYLKTAEKEINEKNFHSLQYLSIVTILILLGLLLLAPLMLDDWHASVYHMAFVPVSAAFCAAVWIYGHFGSRSEKVVRGLCTVFWIEIFSFVILIDVFSNASVQSCFMPLVCIAMPACFIIPMSAAFGLVGFFEVLYIIGCAFCKDRLVGQYDIFCSVSAFAVSVAIYYFIMELRARDHKNCVRFEKLSTRDPLIPELYNKQSGQFNIENYLAVNAQDKQYCSLIVLDVDDFKKVNDTLGHYTGDKALRRVGDVLQRSFRSSDIIARFGGDEFIAFAKGLCDPEKLMEKCNFIQDMLRTVSEKEIGIPIECSMGAIVVNGGREADFDSLFCQADEALYEAKNAGKGLCILKMFDETDKRIKA